MSLISLALLCSACPSVTMSTTTRMALTPSPGTPPALAGASGMGVTMRALPLVPVVSLDKGAVAVPVAHPELSGVVKIGEHGLLSARVAGASDAWPLHQPSGGRVASGSVGVEAMLGGGVQFRFAKVFGAMAAGELGLMVPTITSSDSTFGVSAAADIVPAFRAATGLFFEYGPVRVYGMVLAGDFVGNDASSVRTRACELGCTVTDTGVVTAVPLVGLGGGARVTVAEYFSFGVEAFTSTGQGTAFPLSLAATLRVGKFDVGAVEKKPPPKPVNFEGLTPPPMLIPGDDVVTTPPPL